MKLGSSYHTSNYDWDILFIKDYPSINRYLSSFKSRLIPKPKNWKGEKWEGRKTGPYQWYEIQDAMDYHMEFDKPKIIYLKFQVKPAFALDVYGTYPNSAVWIIPQNDLFLLGLLNSKLGWFLISNYCTQIQNGYQLIYKYLQHIPIRKIDFSDPADRKRHDRMVQLVQRMLDLHKSLAAAQTPNENTALQRQITTTDQQIDRLVYELYNLTDDEIKIVENSASK